MMLNAPGAQTGMMPSLHSPFTTSALDSTGQTSRTPGATTTGFDVGSSSMSHVAPRALRHPAYEMTTGSDGMMYTTGVQMTQPGGYYAIPTMSMGTSYQPAVSQGMSTTYTATIPGMQQTTSAGQVKRPLQGDMSTHQDQDAGRSGSSVYVDQYGRSFMVDGDASGQPAPKRVRHDTYGTQASEYGEVDGAASTVVPDDTRALPPGTRLAVRPSRPKHLEVAGSSEGGRTIEAASLALSDLQAKSKILAIFEAKETTEVDLDVLLAPSPKKPKRAGRRRDDDEEDDGLLVEDDEEEDDQVEETAIDIDQVVDDRGHTVLHWAAAFARDSIIAQLINREADIHRGNFAGETPLIRAILTTNNADRNNLSALLDQYFGPSIKTIDHSHRSVLHHVALVAGIKGRATSANYYMSTLLEWIARHEDDADMKTFVNGKDMQGDTALNVAARVGNKNLVQLLLDAGADPSKANKIGLRPVDYGLEVPVSRRQSDRAVFDALEADRSIPLFGQGLEVVNGFAATPTVDVFSQVPYAKGSDLLKRERL
jgi:ankyrin repeat protein/3D (Asp-Asp-Asp) domain-containing protein